jgi:L-cystine uptake protein TcyP (sodium:dicarboxylate symporter family)
MDYIRRGNNLSTLTIFMILTIVIFVVLNDYMDFVSSENSKMATKIIFGICLIITVGLLIQKTHSINERVSQMIHHEKKQAKKVLKKNLPIF